MIFVTKARLVVLRLVLSEILEFLEFFTRTIFDKNELIRNTEKKHIDTTITKSRLISTKRFMNV